MCCLGDVLLGRCVACFVARLLLLLFFQVHGWEPSRVYDMLPVHWGKVEDMIISGDQLVRDGWREVVCQ